MPDEEVLEVYDEYEGGDWCSAGVLSQLRSLTRLAVNVQGDEGTEAFWCGMANLKMLRELYVREVDISHFGGIMALVGCIRLTSLRVEFKQEIADEPATFEMEVSYATHSTAMHRNCTTTGHRTAPPRPAPPRPAHCGMLGSCFHTTMMHNLAFATSTKLIAQCFLLQNAASATTDTPVASCCCKHSPCLLRADPAGPTP